MLSILIVPKITSMVIWDMRVRFVIWKDFVYWWRNILPLKLQYNRESFFIWGKIVHALIPAVSEIIHCMPFHCCLFVFYITCQVIDGLIEGRFSVRRKKYIVKKTSPLLRNRYWNKGWFLIYPFKSQQCLKIALSL